MLLANIAWTVAYDTEYAMVDRDDDVRLGLKTSAITFGRWDVTAVAIGYALFVALMALVGLQLQWGGLYFLALLGAVAIAAQHLVWIARRDRAQCFRAFRHNNWVGALVFAGIVADHWLAV